MTPIKIPARLFAAYNWLNLAGEIPTLQSLSGDDLLAYCLDVASNANAHGETDVSESDVFALRIHLGGVSSIEWMDWYTKHPAHLEPCCAPNAWGACASTCPRLHPDQAPKPMLAEFLAETQRIKARAARVQP